MGVPGIGTTKKRNFYFFLNRIFSQFSQGRNISKHIV